MMIIDNEPSFSTNISEWKAWLHWLQTDSFMQDNREDESVIQAIQRAQDKIAFFENIELEAQTRPAWVDELNSQAGINSVEFGWQEAQKINE